MSARKDLKGRIVIYSIIGCPHCLAAKSSLQEHGLVFVDVSVDRFPPYVREWLKERTGGKSSVPQIFFNDRLIGGNEELQALMANKTEFEEAINELRTTSPPNPPESGSESGSTAPVLPHPGEALDIDDADADQTRFHCELDEYAALITEMRKAGVVRDHSRRDHVLCLRKKTYKDSFTGKDFVDWVVEKKLISRERAVFMGRQLVSRRFGMDVDHGQEFRDDANALYKLGTSDGERVLNAVTLSECVQRPAAEVAEDLRRLILKIYAEFLSPDGKTVDYEGIAASEAFSTYRKTTMELQRVDLDKISKSDKLAFFINTYNALVIHGSVERGAPSNIWQRFKFFNEVAYSLGGHVFTLNDIENGILRANRGSMATLYRKPFAKNDPRLSLALEECEPRIHFALNCGAKSCPPIKTFSGDQIEEQLKLATEAYLENEDALRIDLPQDKHAAADEEHKDTTTVTSSEDQSASKETLPKAKKEGADTTAANLIMEQSVIHLSMLFKWYHNDFGKDKEAVLKWIYDHLAHEEKKKRLGKALRGTEFKIKYITYDWGHNNKNGKN